LGGLAGGEHHELGAFEVEVLRLVGVEDAVLAVLAERQVGAGEVMPASSMGRSA
jgi:hypothetical protein